jgi:hypothetical protein
VFSLKWYSIGAFTFPSVWGAVVIAFVVTGIFLRLYDSQRPTEWFGNSVFWFILTWKLSFILFNFPAFIRQPLSVIYFHGGMKGFWLGTAAALVYIFIKGKRKYVISAWVLFVLIYEGAAGYLADTASFLDALNLLTGLGLFYLILKFGKKEIWLLVFIGIELLVMNRFGRDAHE